MRTDRPLKLRPVVQRYDWGKLGQDSLIHRLLGSPEALAPAAELWMGAHPSAPSGLEDGNDETLETLVASAPSEMLGKRAADTFGKLPFLLKVLSIRSALSIQAHPDRGRAAELRKIDPAHYPDDNHKPEMAIAVTPVELLYGFRSVVEIAEEVRRSPALRSTLDDDLASRLLARGAPADQELLKDLYTSLMHLPPSELSRSLAELRVEMSERTQDARTRWFETLSTEHGDDVGLLSLFVMNLVRLAPGEAIFVGPNTVHAYLSGDLIECMASSDNVVRAGLTKKFKDLETLISMLHYRPAVPEIILPRPIGGSERHRAYPAPAREFALEALDSKGAAAECTLGRESVAIVFVLAGSGELRSAGGTLSLAEGESAFVPSAAGEVVVRSNGGTAFIAHVP